MDDTPTIYTYVDQWGNRKAVLCDWETATVAQKEIAAAVAGRKQREAWLRKALRAMKNAGEMDEARAIIGDDARFTHHVAKQHVIDPIN